MQTRIPVGIYGLGFAVPEEVRRNDFWPEEFSRKFMERKKGDCTTAESVIKKGATPAEEIALRKMFAIEREPFRGSVERRILPRPTPPSALEVRAAREAVEAAGIDRAEIGLIACSSLPADNITPNNGNIIGRALEVPAALAVGFESGCSAFIVELDFCARMIATGGAKYALLVCSFISSRLTDYEMPASVSFGDGAAAAVIGPVGGNRGILSTSGRSFGSLCHSVVYGSRGADPWYDGKSPVVGYNPDMPAARQLVVGAGDFCKMAIDDVLDRGGLSKKDISSFFCHQPAVWFNEVCRASADLGHVKTVDTYEKYASMGVANVPANLYFGAKDGTVKDDDVVALYSCGAGFNYAAMLLRWGR